MVLSFQGRSFMSLFWGVRDCPANIFFLLPLFVFSVTVVWQCVLGPVNCPAKVRCNTVFALRNGKFSSMLGVTHPHTPFKLCPCILLLISTTLSLRYPWVATVAQVSRWLESHKYYEAKTARRKGYFLHYEIQVGSCPTI